MKYAKVVLLLGTDDFSWLDEPLEKLNVAGVTVSKVMGYGDYYNKFSEFGFSDKMKVEIYALSEDASIIASTLSKLAKDLTEGGGMVAVEPVTSLLNCKNLTG